jgi:nucleoside phosphorylase
MIGLIYTTSADATPFFERFANGQLTGVEEGATVQYGPVLVTITGTGKVKATLYTERLLQQFDIDRVLHVGMGTGLDDAIEIGSLVAASAVLEGDRIALSAPSYPQMPLSPPDALPTGRLVTHDHAMSPETDDGYWQRLADMSDTTGYAVAYVAAQHGIPCQVVKAITGRLGDEQDDFQETLEAARATLTDFVLETIDAAKKQ